MNKNKDTESYNDIQSKTYSLNRIFFLDHLRAFLVILVVFLHSAMAYIVNADNLWYFYDSQRNIIFDVYVFLFDRTVMPIFFFISGYFALSSILKSNTISFLKRKFVRLGIPLIIGIFILNPVSRFIINTYDNKIPNNYLTNIPYTLHLWFLTSLLIIIILFSIIFTFNKRIFKPIYRKNYSSKFLFLFAILIGVSLFLVNLFFNDLKWIGFGGFIITQPFRFVLYISYFFLGVFALKNKIFSKNNPSNNFLFIFATTTIFAIFSILFYNFYHTDISKFLHLKFIYALLWSVFSLSSLITIIKLFQKRYNYSSKYGKKLSINSYAIYIFHYPFVIYLQYILIYWSISPIIKFLIVVVTSISITYLISEYLLFRIPVLKKIL